MKSFNWNTEKNLELKKTRGISFEDIVFFIEKDAVIDIIQNPNQDKYAGQYYFILNINDYVYYIPFAEDENEIFLNTIIPSRKYTKHYLGGKRGEK